MMWYMMWHMPYGMTGDLVVSSLYAAKLGAVWSAKNGGSHHHGATGGGRLTRCRSRWLVNASSPPSPSINQNWLERSQVDGGAGFDCGFLCKKWDKDGYRVYNNGESMGSNGNIMVPKRNPFQLLGQLVLNGLLLNVWKSSFLRALAFPQT